MMSLALLPVGLIAIAQTRAVTEKVRRNTELALLATVEQSAVEERLAIQRALGVADSVAVMVPDLMADKEGCSRRLSMIVESSERFSFAGIIPTSGIMECSTTGETLDVSGLARVQEMLSSTGPLVRVTMNPTVSQTPVITVSIPFYLNEQNAGRVALSIPLASFVASNEGVGVPRPEALKDLITFNAKGEVLTVRAGGAFNDSRLPMGLSLASLAEQKSTAFSSNNRNGEDRIYTVVPIEKGQLYVLGIWDARSGLVDQIGGSYPAILFPALMWLTSLVVVLMATHRLVLRHVRSLRRQMVRFARDRTLREDGSGSEMPAELREIQNSFDTMAYSILQDEARLENAVHEKNVLIREIHHRVKNNLQLISSIVNMQIRNVSNEETKSILRRVQDRVLSLATIHRDLYQNNAAGRVNVGHLVKEILENSVDIGSADGEAVRVKQDIDDVMLYPDQAVPMSLLAAEAATNAMKYASSANGAAPWIHVSFKVGEGKQRIFRFSNSATGEGRGESTGMGTRLINAFAIQLGADIDITATEDTYTMTVIFEAAEFLPQAESY